MTLVAKHIETHTAIGDVGTVINATTVHIAAINNNIFNNSDPTSRPTVQEDIERAGDGFVPGPGAKVEENPTDLGDLNTDVGLGNVCKASHHVCAEWVQKPCILFRPDSIWFNDAVIQAYNLRYGMKIVPTLSEDRKILRFVLGTENFPNPNACNKTGHFNVTIANNSDTYILENKEGHKKHVKRIGLDGKDYPNRMWKLGCIRTGRREKFITTREVPQAIGKYAPNVYLDRRYFNTVVLPTTETVKRYFVLYVRLADLVELPPDLRTKFKFKMRDYFERRGREACLSSALEDGLN